RVSVVPPAALAFGTRRSSRLERGSTPADRTARAGRLPAPVVRSARAFKWIVQRRVPGLDRLAASGLDHSLCRADPRADCDRFRDAQEIPRDRGGAAVLL